MNKSVNNRSYPYPMQCDLDAKDMLITRRDYTAEIENLDKAFATIIDKVRSLGELDNTVVCVSSDHGEMLGDYNTWAKSKPWVASSNVPLMCMGPGIQENVVLDSYVTNMDLAATFLDFSQTAIAPSLNITSMSLRPFLNGSWTDAQHSEYRSYVSSGLNNWRMVVQQVNDTVTWKYVCCQGQCPARKFDEVHGLVQLLFNIKQDLYEEKNIIAQYPTVANSMKEWLPTGFCVPGDYTDKWADAMKEMEKDDML
jgi:arylsulfatase A-like enzyme